MQSFDPPSVRSRSTIPMLLAVLYWAGGVAPAADRTTFFLPLPSDAAATTDMDGVLPDQGFGPAAPAGWSAYLRIWQAHHAAPDNPLIRRFLGLPLTGTVEIRRSPGRTSQLALGWRAGQYQQLDTPHFRILSRAPQAAEQHLAEDLERCYWVWTQMFFPLWEARAQVTTALAKLQPDQSVADYLQQHASRLTIRRELRVVFFSDAREYRRVLGKDVPGIERSTGYYNDHQKTVFLYASESDDAATRRHELVHQLFREATRSGLRGAMPAEQAEFWLVEGIAGYFESLAIHQPHATVGGWDAPRLQFARYRMLAGGDLMPLDELRRDGRLAAQRRDDLARWYAHAIAQTHHLLDGGDLAQRHWIYHQLAEQYRVKTNLPPGRLAESPELGLKRFLQVNDTTIQNNPPRRNLVRLCLNGCELTAQGLRKIPPSPSLAWLDLSGIAAVDNQTVNRLAPNPKSLHQLSLERTAVNAGLADWLGKATNLVELDLSGTAVDDAVIQALAPSALAPSAPIEVLWLTDTRISDRSIDVISRLSKLESVDVQLTGVSEAALARLRKIKPNLSINPLQLRPQ